MGKLFVFMILIFVLLGCTTNSDEESVSDKSVSKNGTKQIDDINTMKQFDNDTIQVGDFIVSLHAENESNVYATITYVGDEFEKTIFHGGSIFHFDIYQLNGELEYQSFMTLKSEETTLIRNEPLKEYLYGIKESELKEGIYKIEATANFYLNPENEVESRLVVPISKFHEIKGL